MNNTELQKECQIIREDILKMIHDAHSGHPGGSLSATELLTCLYFGGVMHVDSKNPDDENRDYFILSKGHVAPVLYAVLGEMGFFDKSAFQTLRKFGSILQGHPHKGSTPGLDCSAGSLGQGLSIADGIAIAMKKQNKPNRVYCLLGDGELDEGQCWEAAMTAPQHQLDNVCAIVDYNHVQLDGTVEEIKNLDHLVKRWQNFGWNVIEINGHCVSEVMDAYSKAEQCKGKPTVIIAHTIKGKGVSFMENNYKWHGTAPNDEQLEAALKEVRGKLIND